MVVAVVVGERAAVAAEPAALAEPAVAVPHRLATPHQLAAETRTREDQAARFARGTPRANDRIVALS